ncbi:MAG: flagellar hook-basal body complex protein FliE, partial [Rickettsiaceae bacterium]|nr:flagellar hook-basal body complex protein FliE [Rickettsiaceae bacterium]
LKQNRNIVPSQEIKVAEKQMDVLRLGDDMVVKADKKASFPDVLQEILGKEVNKVSLAEKRVKNSLRSTLDDSQSFDQLEIMSALNESETALQIVIAARDRFINSYQEIMKMPL